MIIFVGELAAIYFGFAFVLVYYLFLSSRNPTDSVYSNMLVLFLCFYHRKPVMYISAVILDLCCFTRMLFRFINTQVWIRFLSQHGNYSTRTCVTYFIYDRRLGEFWFVVFAVLISVGEVVAGVHYPFLDALTGFVIGFIVPFLLICCFLKFVNSIRR